MRWFRRKPTPEQALCLMSLACRTEEIRERRLQAVQEMIPVEDNYREYAKMPEPVVCACGAIAGRRGLTGVLMCEQCAWTELLHSGLYRKG